MGFLVTNYCLLHKLHIISMKRWFTNWGSGRNTCILLPLNIQFCLGALQMISWIISLCGHQTIHFSSFLFFSVSPNFSPEVTNSIFYFYCLNLILHLISFLITNAPKFVAFIKCDSGDGFSISYPISPFPVNLRMDQNQKAP